MISSLIFAVYVFSELVVFVVGVVVVVYLIVFFLDGGQINTRKLIMNIRGKSDTPLAPHYKAGMIVRADGTIDYQSAEK